MHFQLILGNLKFSSPPRSRRPATLDLIKDHNEIIVPVLYELASPPINELKNLYAMFPVMCASPFPLQFNCGELLLFFLATLH